MLDQVPVDATVSKEAAVATAAAAESELQLLAEYAKPFQFLNLGALAYVGASQV